jgi:lambda repressor-like predicted transcriptional regulator
MNVGTLFYYNGQWRTLATIARMSGTNRQTIRNRLDRGLSLTEALAVQSNAVLYTFAGKTQSISAWAKETGLNYETLRERLRQHRWPIERALTEPSIHAAERAMITRNRRRIRSIGTGFRKARNAQLIHRISADFRQWNTARLSCSEFFR